MTGTPAPGAPYPPEEPGIGSLTVTGLLLLDPHGHDPTVVESITFDDSGIGVVRSRGQDARVLHWDAVVAHAVEPWAGGVIPGWWVDPTEQLAERPEPSREDTFATMLAEQRQTSRRLPHAEPGAMISIQTRTGTYRFLRSGGDPFELAGRIAELAVHHRGSAGVSTVTTVAPGRDRHVRRADRSGWARVRPWLVALLFVTIAAAAIVILLQSAGVIHLPFLGGGSPAGAPAPPTSG